MLNNFFFFSGRGWGVRRPATIGLSLDTHVARCVACIEADQWRHSVVVAKEVKASSLESIKKFEIIGNIFMENYASFAFFFFYLLIWLFIAKKGFIGVLEKFWRNLCGKKLPGKFIKLSKITRNYTYIFFVLYRCYIYWLAAP